jgi:hypothetical protein
VLRSRVDGASGKMGLISHRGFLVIVSFPFSFFELIPFLFRCYKRFEVATAFWIRVIMTLEVFNTGPYTNTEHFDIIVCL